MPAPKQEATGGKKTGKEEARCHYLQVWYFTLKIQEHQLENYYKKDEIQLGDGGKLLYGYHQASQDREEETTTFVTAMKKLKYLGINLQ